LFLFVLFSLHVYTLFIIVVDHLIEKKNKKNEDSNMNKIQHKNKVNDWISLEISSSFSSFHLFSFLFHPVTIFFSKNNKIEKRSISVCPANFSFRLVMLVNKSGKN